MMAKMKNRKATIRKQSKKIANFYNCAAIESLD
jgi:hypothetical protein